MTLGRETTPRARRPLSTDAFFDRLREHCLSLPEARERLRSEGAEFRVGRALFCAYDGRTVPRELRFRVPVRLRRLFLGDKARFVSSGNVGRIGWVTLRLGPTPDWLEIEWLVAGSHWLVARDPR